MRNKFRAIEMTDDIAAKLDERTMKNDADECWAWTGRTSTKGYAVLSIKYTDWYAHRLSYTRHKGAIPEGMVIDHLCRNTECINPDHLEAVTDQTNVLRGVSPGAKATRNDACKHGHPRSEYGRRYGPRIHCTACSAINVAAFKARRRAS
jgi:hypothetical protein